MATTVNIDDDSAEELVRLTGASTKNEATRLAIAEFIRMKRKQKLLALRGNWEIVDNWQELRELELEPSDEEAADD